MTDDRVHNLIIAGVTRAATTSLYHYLADHPRVGASTIKETRFFMDSDELKRLARFEEGLSAYERFFPGCPADAVRLEATPDYFYRPAVARRIAEALPDVLIVVILRDPIDRLVSWRRYAIQNGLLDPSVTLSEYIQRQFDAEAAEQSPPQHLRALREGRYSDYLGAWIEAFGPGRLIVRNYTGLMRDPRGIVGEVCQRAGLDPSVYDGYDFAVHNASRRVRWPRLHAAYRAAIWRVKPHVHDKPAVRGALRGVRRSTDALLGRRGPRAGHGDDAGDQLSDEDRRRLEDYYRDEPAKLAKLLGRVDWVW